MSVANRDIINPLLIIKWLFVRHDLQPFGNKLKTKMSSFHPLEVGENLNYFIWHFHPFSAGTVFIRHNLRSIVDPRTERIKIFLMAIDP